MKLGGRIAAAEAVLDDCFRRRTPASDALRDWGKSNRFAGSKDRSAIGNIVHDVLRRRLSLAWVMDDDRPRALVLAALRDDWKMDADAISVAFKDDKFSPEPLSAREIKMLSGAIKLSDAPECVQADVPDWIWPEFYNNFGDEAIEEGRALSRRAPLDLRVNRLKSDQKSALKLLAGTGAHPCPIAPNGLRIAPGFGLDRLPNITADPAFLTGAVEIQDAGSQIAALMLGAQPGETVLDYCAGGGGKTLALAAEMRNSGALHAYDIDKRRLAPLYQRAMRAGATNIEVHQPPGKSLAALKGKMDRVLVDAPCSGSGTWRRKPDSKWRLSLSSLETRTKEQKQVLQQASAYVRPGGIFTYLTCSVLGVENEAQIYGFLESNPDFSLLSAGELWEERIGVGKAKPWSEDGCTVTMTPASTDTDGFFCAVMVRRD